MSQLSYSISLLVREQIVVKPGEIRCPRCKSKDVVSSGRAGLFDALMEGFGRVPRHCRACGRRFYVSQRNLAAAAEPRS